MRLYGQHGPECPRCNQDSKLAVVIQRLGTTPESRFYECKSCNHLFAPAAIVNERE
jgi:DNA-directed RNA polymerase subunit M/transcription elongation factor TFIIS